MCNNCQLLWDSLVVALAAVCFTFVGFSVGHSNGQKWSTDCDHLMVTMLCSSQLHSSGKQLSIPDLLHGQGIEMLFAI